MNFFEHQAKARTQSARLVFLFAVTVLGTMLAMGIATWVAVGWLGEDAIGDTAGSRAAGVAAALVTLLVIVVASLWKSIKLRGGGGVVARQLGATLVSSDTGNPRYRRLRNVVEEIAIASGVPVPEVYVLESETAINAFASGWQPADAAITVTRGALDHLNRDELQGVIAHEFSHVLNGDMRLNIRLMGVLFGILVIGILGRELLAGTRGGGKKGGAMAIALAMLVIGYTGLFFGRLIKAGVSRQREHLADASAVQFTRQARGLAGALHKIRLLPGGSRIETPEVEEVTHMLFSDGVGYSRLFATHPELDERLQRIDPRGEAGDVKLEPDTVREHVENQDARARAAALGANPAPGVPASSGHEASPALGFVGAAAMAAGGTPATPARNATRRGPPPLPGRASAAEPGRVTLQPKVVSGQVGNPSGGDFDAAGDIRLGIPEGLRAASRVQDEAVALVFALALDADSTAAAKQLNAVESALGGSVRVKVDRFRDDVAALHPLQRLPLAALAFPALRRRPRSYLEHFAAALDAVIRADDDIKLSEYCLARLVRVQVLDVLDPSGRRPMGRRKLKDCKAELMVILGALAKHGHADDDTARRAYVDGMRGLATDGSLPPYLPSSDPVTALDAALDTLDALDPTGKELVVEALTRVMAHDGRVEVAEAELLRAICASLHCPLPPSLAEVD